MKKLHLFFISTPGIGNLVPLVEFAQLVTQHHPQFTATILTITVPERPIVNAYINSRGASLAADRHLHDVNFLHLPPVGPLSPDEYQSSLGYLCVYIEKHKLHVKHAIEKIMTTESDSVAGFFVDMFCTSMIDVANELGIPCYIYFASPASFLGFMLHFPTLDKQLATEFVDSDTELIVPKDSTTELVIPSFVNPLPPLILPTTSLKRKKDGYFWYLYHGRRYMEAKGIVVNTFRELEPYAIDSVSIRGLPPVYPIGPVLDLAGPAEWHPDRPNQENIMKWLDNQPPSSVVFLCFGSMGSLKLAQLKEIAIGLDRARFRFLWAIREAPKSTIHLPDDYTNLERILPDGFLNRTAGMGLVCGWVPQVTILSHKAIGGFVSHCGWNSILESIWYGVPIATWPVYAEQQMNAFELVKELGLAVEIRLDYREGSDLVSAEELEKGLGSLMDGDSEVRRKVKEMQEKSRRSLMENGSSSSSSYKSLKSLIDELLVNI
ncbi:UDP-glycosyltransferase 43-like [Pistacia vera]|uniref:UDP-glycosyltransferase 43-like n=1 Tax=Pistacia vera TaxID=55513 RepID=UPI001262C50B|nr:UDP-glycosyltransferase 43-like [Pistacia vera]